MLASELYGFAGRETDGRRAEESERKVFNIGQLWQRSHEILNLAALGYKNTDIARILNVSPVCVSNTINSDLGVAKLSDLRKSRDEEVKMTTERIRCLTERALDTYFELFDNEKGEASLKDRKDGAKDVLLELSGLRAATKVHNVNTTLTAQDIEDMKNRGRSFIDITPPTEEIENV
jgi:predicted transcriptional regulator